MSASGPSGPLVILRGHKFPCTSFSEDHFGIANSVDPDEMPLNAAFHVT